MIGFFVSSPQQLQQTQSPPSPENPDPDDHVFKLTGGIPVSWVNYTDIAVDHTDTSMDQADSSEAATIGHPLPQSKFLDIQSIIELMRNPSAVHTEIPTGEKSNVYFVLDNTKNQDLRQTGSRSSFTDDCGFWNATTTSSPKTTYLITDNTLKKLFDRQGVYCLEKSVSKTRIYTPLEPQPSSNQLLTIQRYYVTAKCDKIYKKRITWILHSPPSFLSSTNLAVVEYQGTFPGLIPHGSNTTTNTHYTRTTTETMKKITETTKTLKPRAAYNKLLQECDITDAPKELHQIDNKNHHDKKKNVSNTHLTRNLWKVVKGILFNNILTEMCNSVRLW